MMHHLVRLIALGLVIFAALGCSAPITFDAPLDKVASFSLESLVRGDGRVDKGVAETDVAAIKTALSKVMSSRMDAASNYAHGGTITALDSAGIKLWEATLIQMPRDHIELRYNRRTTIYYAPDLWRLLHERYEAR